MKTFYFHMNVLSHHDDVRNHDIQTSLNTRAGERIFSEVTMKNITFHHHGNEVPVYCILKIMFKTQILLCFTYYDLNCFET